MLRALCNGIFSGLDKNYNLEFFSNNISDAEVLNKILSLYKPTEMAIEKLFFNSNRKTAVDVAQARGVILLASQINNLNCFEYTPLQVKQSVTGYGRATKQQVIEMTTKILNLKKIPKPDDVADSLAVAVAHLHSSCSRLFNLKENKI